MPYSRDKAKSGWLVSFGDLVTLLITLFILVLVMNKSELSKVQVWSSELLDNTVRGLNISLDSFKYVSVKRTMQGIEVNIVTNSSFIKGGFEPVKTFRSELQRLGVILGKMPFLVKENGGIPEDILLLSQKNGLVFVRKISVSGHTDNDAINPNSALRNNWFLSSMRAQSVMNILFEASSLSPKLFIASGFGENRPIVPNSTEENKQKNRRIQIEITANFEKIPN